MSFTSNLNLRRRHNINRSRMVLRDKTLEVTNQRVTKSETLQNIENREIIESRERKVSKIVSLVIKIDSFLSPAFFFGLVKAVQLKAVLGTLVSLSSKQPDSLRGKANVIFSWLTVILYSLLILVIFLLISNEIEKIRCPCGRSSLKASPQSLKSTKNTQKGKNSILVKMSLFSDIKNENRFEFSKNSKTILLHMLQDLLIPVLLVVFVESPYIQILGIMGIMSVVVYSLIKNRPYKDNKRNVLDIGNKLLYLLILVIFLVGHSARNKMSKKDSFLYVGYGVMTLIVLLAVFNFIVAFFSILQKI